MSVFKLFKKQEKQIPQEQEEAKKAFVVDTNVPLHCVRFGAVASLNALPGAFIPWAVIRELMTSARLAENDESELKNPERRLAWRKALLAQGWDKEKILARESRCPYAKEACSIVQAKINRGEWKTVGTYEETKMYFNGFPEELKQWLSRVDLEVLASCYLLAEADCDVVLITRDRRLRETAESFGIQTQEGISVSNPS